MTQRSKKKPAKRVKAGTSKVEAAKKRAAFVEAYIVNGGNATQAAISAGFSAKTAGSKGEQVLKEVEVAAAIAERSKKLAAITGLDTERTLREVARLAYSDPRKFYKEDGTLIPVRDLDDDAAACVAQVEVDEIKVEGGVIGQTVKLKQWDKNAALEKAMKHHGLYKEDNKQKGESLTLKVEFGPG